MTEALFGVPWWSAVGAGAAGLALGWLLRHLWGRQSDRANEGRLEALCGYLDVKNARLDQMKAELREVQGLNLVLQAERAAHAALPADTADTQEACSAAPQTSMGCVIRMDRAWNLQDELALENNEDCSFVNRRIHALQKQPVFAEMP